MSSTIFQALSWDARDVEDPTGDGDIYTISIIGRTEDGQSVCVSTVFAPYFFIKIARRDQSKSGIYRLFNKLVGLPISYDIVKGKDLWGFQNNEQSLFMKLNFSTQQSMRKCASKLRYHPLDGETFLTKVYESNIDPVIRFMHRTGIQSTGWLSVPSEFSSRAVPPISRCDIDLECSDWRKLVTLGDTRDDVAPFVVASFDIESYSSTGKFPSPDTPGDQVFQIAFSLRKANDPQDTEPYEKVCLCYKQTDGPDCVSFSSEKDLLMGFRDYVVSRDLDILTGWNIFGFDLEYLFKRAAVTGCPPKFYQLGKLLYRRCEMVYKQLSSSALGDNKLKLLPMSGRYIFDLFQEIKKEKKLDSYALNAVSKVFLGDQKIDMPPKEMFRRFREEDPQLLGEVAEYCIKDTLLPHRLMTKLCTLLNLLEMAKATWVPVSFLSERGQQIKVFSQITKEAREQGYFVPTLTPPGKNNTTTVEQEGYEGATVLEAQKGAYYTPITALDFASLYPSIMMAHNFCYSTLVLDPKYDNLPGVTYETFKVGTKTHKFAQDVPSLLPGILAKLKLYRKKAKKDMASARGTPMESVYNGKQLAYKISMNSVYGFTGAVSTGILPCMAIASSVTCKGRSMIDETKEYVEAHFPGSKVRYGDSVMPDTPVLLRCRGEVFTKCIEDIAPASSEWNDYPGFVKEGATDKEVCDLESWTHLGWQPIKRVIRHRCKKAIWRVLTHTGLVDVTEDHSLLDKNLNQVRPGEVKVGTELFHSDCVPASQIAVVDDNMLFVFGVFVGDGSCGTYNCPSGKKSAWAINNTSIELLEKCKRILDTNYANEFKFVIMDTLKSSGVYKLSPRGKGIIGLVQEWRSLCYDGASKKIPQCAMSRESFLDGLWASDGCRRDNEVGGCLRIDTKNQVTAQWYFLYLKSLGLKVSLNTRTDKPNIFRLTFTKSKLRKNEFAIKKLYVLHEGGSEDRYVYDLETEAGSFQAGVGNLIVKNTDSVMIEFDTGSAAGTQEAINASWELGKRAAAECTKLFKKPNDLELEKVYCPYFLYSKKRYAAKMWTADPKTGEVVFDCVDIKGLQVVRRDNTPHVREVCKEILDIILESNNPTAAKECAHRRGVELLGGKVPIEKLTLSQKLGDSYKGKRCPRECRPSDGCTHCYNGKVVNLAHVNVRNKIRRRAPGSEPQSGDRVPYVLVNADSTKQCDKAEDPNWVTANPTKACLDYHYYFDNKFMTPVCDLLEPLVENPKLEIFSDLISKKPIRIGKNPITNFFHRV
jgi:DNA polymerase elongation subunit (family B)